MKLTKGRSTGRQNARLLIVALVVAIAMVFSSLMSMPVQGQGSGEHRAEALVLVNAASGSYMDFEHYIQPYLDHFGIAYTPLDIATTPVPADIADYALVVVGHKELDPDGLYLDSAEQTLVSTAVAGGSGLVNFDNVLADGALAPIYQYVQDVFQFSYGASTAGSQVEILSDAGPPGDYIVAAQPTDAVYTLDGDITPVGVIPPGGAATLATVGGQPFLVATQYGLGRAVQWTTYDWLDKDIWGYVRGFDDLVWSGLVWAARKPFVMQGLPPLVTFRTDDAVGPYSWVTVANNYGFKPWLGIMVDWNGAYVDDLKAFVDAGQATVGIHSWDGSVFYEGTDEEVADKFAMARAWFAEHEITHSKIVVPHYYYLGTNVFDGLESLGVEFLCTVLTPGDDYGDPAIVGAPYRLYEAPDSAHSAAFYYADFVSVPGHPEHDGRFFNNITEIRDVTGYDWVPDTDVPGSIEVGTLHLKRALDGMAVATLFIHGGYAHSLDLWDQILAGITSNIASYQPIYVTMEEAAQYARAMYTSNIASSVYDPVRRMLDTTLTGSTDLPTQFYLFAEQGGVIQHTFVDVPVFSDSVIVSVSMDIPTPTPTHTPGPSPTPTNTFTPGPTATPTSTPTDTPTPTPTPTLPAGVAFWDDLDPVRETWTHYAAQGVDDWTLSTAYSHSPTHAYFSSDASSVKDDYLLTGAFVVPADAQLSFWHTYQLEAGGDGVVIEISTDGGATFTDLGPHITTGGYTGDIATGWGSPIGGRSAWTGGSLGAMTEVVADLSSYAGQSAILRFRLACDSGGAAAGWYIDDVLVGSSTITPTPTHTPTETPTATPTETPGPSPTPTNTFTPGPTATPTNTPTSSPTPAPTPTGSLTPTLTPSPIHINVWEDAHQDPVLATTSSVGDLVIDDNQWTEFLWEVRGYPGVFASYVETPPLMRFYGAVPDGTYTLVANLYWSYNLRYYWGTSAANPEEFSYDVTSGNSGDFAEYTLGTVTVTGGTFELYVRHTDPLPGGSGNSFWGWAWIRLIPQGEPPTPTATSSPPATATWTPTHTPTATALPTSTPTATDTPIPSPTATLTSTATDTPTATALPTSTPTATDTPIPSPTATFTSTPTDTPTATALPTSTPTATDTPIPSPTATFTSTPTDTPTATALPTSTPTHTATATALPTSTPTATDTPIPSPTATLTSTATDTPTATALPTSTPTATDTPIPSPTVTFTSTPTDTPTATDTLTPSPTATSTSTPTNTPTLPASGHRAEAVILINTSSAGYLDFVHYIQPYLDHFGIAYTPLDIATAPVTANIANYALIVVGHKELDPDHLYLDSAEQTLISTAVAGGTGLVNFDSVLADGSLTPLYEYVQDVFGFGYVEPTEVTRVEIHSDSGLVGSYIVGLQDEDAVHEGCNITPAGVIAPAGAGEVATAGGQPFVVAVEYGLGRAVQWTSYEWLYKDQWGREIWGYMRGFDDLVWRGLVWAARKPFVMQGMPPLVTFRDDDSTGPYDWVVTANAYGFKPWLGIFLRQISDEDAAVLRTLVDGGQATVGVHSLTYENQFYTGTDAEVAANFAEAEAWFSEHEITHSKIVVPHFYEIGVNAFEWFDVLGIEYVCTALGPGDDYGDTAFLGAPYRRYEAPSSASSDPFYYADFVTVPGHPEHDGRFFDSVTEIRDQAGYEWYPDNNVAETVARGTAQLKRALDSMAMGTLFTHEHYIQGIDPEHWEQILAGIVTNMASYEPVYATMEEAAQYARAVYRSDIVESVYDPVREMLDTTLVGETDIPTQFYLFAEQGGQIVQWSVDVPVFTDSVLVSASTEAPPLPTPTPTSTPTNTPTNTPTPLPTPTLPAGVVFWDDFDPVKESWTHYAGAGTDDWQLSTAYAHSPSHSYFSSNVPNVKDDYLLTSAFVVPADAQLSFWHTYQLENGADGAVIELSTDGGTTFTDLGPHITTGGYTGSIFTGWGNPIGGRMAWTGGSLGAMTEVVVDLSSYAGQTAILRFRLACDSGAALTGWYIDDVRINGSTLTLTPTPTPTPGPTSTPTNTSTPGPTATPTSTPTDTPTPTPTPTLPAGVVFWDDFDPVRETWTHYAAQGVDDWQLSTAYSHSPTHAYFSSNVPNVKDDYLLTSAFVVPADAQLSFWHTYQLENGADGAVIELSTDGGTTFTDLGPHITTGGYTGSIFTGWGNPIGGRMAWTGGSLGAMTEVVVDLSSYAGQTAVLRFRLACDSGAALTGWYIDDVRVESSTQPDSDSGNNSESVDITGSEASSGPGSIYLPIILQ